LSNFIVHTQFNTTRQGAGWRHMVYVIQSCVLLPVQFRHKSLKSDIYHPHAWC